MEATLILATVAKRAQEKKSGYTWRYDSINLEPKEVFRIEAHKNLYLLVGEPRLLTITSDRGIYGLGGIEEHEHSGNIEITNTDSQSCKVQLLKVIWQPNN